jgi:hypothetical protein
MPGILNLVIELPKDQMPVSPDCEPLMMSKSRQCCKRMDVRFWATVRRQPPQPYHSKETAAYFRLSQKGIVSNTCRHSGVQRLERHSKKLTMVCSSSADCRDSPSKNEKGRRARGLISHGSVVPLFGVPPCAVRTGVWTGGAWRIRRCRRGLKQSMSQSTARCASLSEHLLQPHSSCTPCSPR